MKRFIIAGGLAILLARPAHATGGLICATAGQDRIYVALVISHTAVPSVVSARFSERGRDLPVTTAQSWLDEKEIRLDLVDRNASRHEARLRAVRNGSAYDGSIWRHGKRRWVRCREG